MEPDTGTNDVEFIYIDWKSNWKFMRQSGRLDKIPTVGQVIVLAVVNHFSYDAIVRHTELFVDRHGTECRVYVDPLRPLKIQEKLEV